MQGYFSNLRPLKELQLLVPEHGCLPRPTPDGLAARGSLVGKPGRRTLLPVPSALALVGCQGASLALNPLSSPNPPFLLTGLLSRFHRKGLDTVLKKLPVALLLQKCQPPSEGGPFPPLPCQKRPMMAQETFKPSKLCWLHCRYWEEVSPLWGLFLGSMNILKRTSKGAVHLWVHVHSTFYEILSHLAWPLLLGCC